ncbi:MAG TPA: carboxymuconolactone decarboxylase family protein [Kineosporiaceae bacterium]|nr:carboxymuconolactone decarboxylase family protein [Kineosporiaceae bacterium]
MAGLDELKEALPGYARDLKLNLGSVIGTSTLPEQRLWGTVLAVAIASRNDRVTAALAADARGHLSDTAFDAAAGAAAVMAQNNIYYRAKHLLSEGGIEGYDEIPARLRMQIIGSSGGVDKADFEFWCLAVSAINGCGACLASHEQVLREAGVPREQVHEALRIASTVHAVAATLQAHDALQADAVDAPVVDAGVA